MKKVNRSKYANIKNESDYNLQVLYPQIAKEWNHSRNHDLKPIQIKPYSGKRVWWQCEKGHEWASTIANRTYNNSNCPECYNNNRGVTRIQNSIRGSNSLKEKCPELIKEWHPTKNSNTSADKITYVSRKKVWWMCKKRHEWPATVVSRTKYLTGCPYCCKDQTSIPEQIIYYYCKKLFADSKNRHMYNQDTEIDIYIPSFIIGIEYDGHFYHNNIASIERDQKKNKILKDAGIKLIRIREDKCPNIDTYEQYTIYCKPRKNYNYMNNVIIDIFNIIKQNISDYKLLQIINNFIPNVEEDLIEIYTMINSKYKEYNISNSHPSIAHQWDYDRNGALIPEYFSACSHIVVWWKCEKGHEWSSPISRRTNGNSKCPYCTGRYADSNNNLLISYPNIAKEWHPFKNKIRPENLTPHSNIHIWWKCINDHEWFASIDNRTKINGTNCPICAKETTIKTRISNLILNGNSLSSKFPNLSNEWHPSKNFNLHPTDVTPGCNKKVWWKCSNCGYSWLATINNRTNKNSGCPKCSRRSEIYV